MRTMILLAALVTATACGRAASSAGDEHADHAAGAEGRGAHAAVGDPFIPAGAAEASARLAASPRHGEWVMIPAGDRDSVRAWIVYPERSTPAPVILVVHEIFGLSHWIRAVADQLAADGFIAIAPDLLTGKDVPAGAEGPDPDVAREVIRTVLPEEVHRRLDAAARWGMALPAGHGFLRAQDGQDGANLAATRAAWPETIDWFRTHLERTP